MFCTCFQIITAVQCLYIPQITLLSRSFCISKYFSAPIFTTFLFDGMEKSGEMYILLLLLVPVRYIGDFALFNVCSSSKNCPSARCASAANVVCRDVDVFGAENVQLNNFL
jgi:hypothetical protein